MFSIRRLEYHDADDLLRWRNEPNNRTGFLDTRELSYEEHAIWVRDAIAQGTAWVGVVRGHRVGTASLYDYYCTEIAADRSLEFVTFGRLVVAPEFRGQRFGQRLTEALVKRAFEVCPWLDGVVLKVRSDNERARRAYEAVGFCAKDDTDGVIEMVFRRYQL